MKTAKALVAAGAAIVPAELDGLPLPLGEREAAALGEGRAERDAGAEPQAA